MSAVEVEVTVGGDVYVAEVEVVPGRPATRWDPPEEAEVEITSLTVWRTVEEVEEVWTLEQIEGLYEDPSDPVRVAIENAVANEHHPFADEREVEDHIRDLDAMWAAEDAVLRLVDP